MDFIDGIPFVKKGFGLDQTWFAGSRLGVCVAKHGGIADISYYGHQTVKGAPLFKAHPVAAFLKLFRMCVVIDGLAYYCEFNNTRFFASGFESACEIQGVHFSHELSVVDETIVQRVRILKKPAKSVVTLRLVTHGGPILVRRDQRIWSAWEILDRENALLVSAKDARTDTLSPEDTKAAEKEAETFVAVSSDQKVTIEKKNLQTDFKFHCDTVPFKDEASFFVCFGWDKKEVLGRVTRLRQNVGKVVDTKQKQDATLRARRPAFKIPNKTVASLLAQAPAVIDSLKVSDLPGGMRACASHYWIWNWDAMIASKSLMFAGDGKFVEQMLAFYRNHSDEKHGIFFCLDTQLRRVAGVKTTSWPTQCFYNIMLYSHYCSKRDAAVLREYFPFARLIIDRNLESEVKGTGLIEGISHFPDFPEFMGQDFHDIAALPNSIYYQGLIVTRDMSKALAEIDGDASLREYADLLDAKARLCRESFKKHLFDPKKGYFYDSVSSLDFSKRRHYPSFAIMWATPFAADLIKGIEKPISSFMARNFIGPQGIYGFPLSDQKSFLADGNQYSAYYPPMEAFIRNVMSLTGKSAELDNWTEVVEWFWSRHTVPEALTFDAVNLAATPDCVGGKQAFTAKPWLEIFYTAIAGVDLDINGLSLRPTPVAYPIQIKNVHVGDSTLDISISGKGSRIAASLNGKAVKNPNQIPLSALKMGTNTLKVRRLKSK